MNLSNLTREQLEEIVMYMDYALYCLAVIKWKSVDEASTYAGKRHATVHSIIEIEETEHGSEKSE